MPCIVLDTLGASGTIYNDCIKTSDLYARELEYVKSVGPYSTYYALPGTLFPPAHNLVQSYLQHKITVAD